MDWEGPWSSGLWRGLLMYVRDSEGSEPGLDYFF